MKNLPEAIQHVEEFLRDNLETESCNTQHEELLGFLKELQARRSTPLYTPVKPEDITEGHYWAVMPDGAKTVEYVNKGYIKNYCVMDGEDGKVMIDVNDLLNDGWVFYRIPNLPDLEVAE